MAVISFPGIDPIIFSIGPVAIRWYGLLYVLSYAAAFFIIRGLARQGFLRANPEKIDSLIYWVLGCGVVGARLGYVVFYNPVLLSDPLTVLKVWEGGLASHGGLVGTIVGFSIYTRLHQVNWYRLADSICLATFPAVLGVRTANFINGELYGRVAGASVPWAMRFPTDPVATHMMGIPNDLAPLHKERLIQQAYDAGIWEQVAPHVPLRHPSQLYEALGEGILLGLIIWAIWWKTRENRLGTGVYAGIFIAGYGFLRLLIEFFRQPDQQFATADNPVGTVFFGLSMGQLLSSVMVIAGTVMLTLRWKYREPDRPPVEAAVVDDVAA